MSSIMGYIFGNASAQVMSRIESMRSTEAKLLTYARRFGDDASAGTGSSSREIQAFDTKIPRSVVPTKNISASCMFLPGSHDDDEGSGIEDDDDSFIIHGVRVQTKITSGESTSSPLVMIHGYANGAMYFYRNIVGLCGPRAFSTVYSLDLLGWGLSSRPSFTLTDSSIETAEAFFVESLEAWREAHNIEKFVLAGHSLGGYISVAYCERYPERVDRLILISPVGVPERSDEDDDVSDKPLKFRMWFTLTRTFWKNGITPGQFVRAFTEGRGRNMVSGYVENRMLAITSEDERAAFSEYLYTNNALLPASGEYCLDVLLKPGAYARRPVVYRIPKLRLSHVSFIYGAENDWMGIEGGLETQRACQEMSENESNTSVPNVEVHRVKNAGHLVMLDNWEDFNSAMMVASGRDIEAAADEHMRQSLGIKSFRRTNVGVAVCAS